MSSAHLTQVPTGNGEPDIFRDAEGRAYWSDGTEIVGREAIDVAEAMIDSIELCKYADPIEDARDGLTIDEANEIMAQDPSLIFARVRGAARVDL